MSFFSKLLGGVSAEPIEAIGNVFNQIFTSDEEKLQAEAVLTKLAQQPHILQAEINKIEAGHRSIFVAGWRPCIGWVCGIGLSFPFIINPILQWSTGLDGPVLPTADLTSMVLALLGLGTLRTVEKLQGKAK